MLQLLVTSPALSVMASHKYPMLLMLFGDGVGVSLLGVSSPQAR